MIEFLLICFFVLIISVISAITHEKDMRNSIEKYGHTGKSGWLGRISGKIDY